MKTIGLLGGMSWESTADYYRVINEAVKQRLGGLHSAEIVLVSVDFDPIEKLQHAGDWQATATLLAAAAQRVEAAGADVLLICTNTMHKVAPTIEKAIHIPLLHIADATATVLTDRGIRTVGLLGTAFTMEQDFYTGRLKNRFGIDVRVPAPAERRIIHDIIYRELCLGLLKEDAKQQFLRVITSLAKTGAEAVILGCTEIGMLVKQRDTPVALLDTTAIHAQQAVRFALQPDSSAPSTGQPDPAPIPKDL